MGLRLAVLCLAGTLFGCGGPGPQAGLGSRPPADNGTETPPAENPPAPAQTGPKSGTYFGGVGWSNAYNFGHPMLVGAGRAMTMSCDYSALVIDMRYSVANGSLSGPVRVGRYPGGERLSGTAGSGSFADGRFDIPAFMLHDGSGSDAGNMSLTQGYSASATEHAVALDDLVGHYASAATDDYGAFDGHGQPWQLEILPDHTMRVGTCWVGGLSLVAQGTSTIAIYNAPAACDDHYSGLMSASETEIFVLLTQDDGDGYYFGTFPRN